MPRGSIRVVFDAAGAVTARADYEPFGASVTASTTGVLPREQFTGQQRDSEVGLDYFGARFYQAVHGRMLSIDPLYTGAVGDPQRWNRYAYALNSPAVYSDPDGRRTCTGMSVGSLDSCSQTVIAPNTATRPGFAPGYSSLIQSGQGGVNDAYEQDYGGFAYRTEPTPCGGLTRCAAVEDSRILVQAFKLEIDEDWNVTFVPDPDPDTSIPIGPQVNTVGGSGGRLLGAIWAKLFGRAAPAVPTATNQRLQRTLAELFRQSDRIPGGTAGAIRHEMRTGELVGGRSHIQKGIERATTLERILKQEPLSPTDTATAERVLQDLRNALGGQ